MITSNQNSPYNESIANEYDKYSFIWTLYPPLLKQLFRLSKKHSVLDLGCGTGSLLIDIHAQIPYGTGIDLSAPMIAQAIKKTIKLGITNLHFDVRDILNYRTDNKYDLVVCTDGVLPYLRDKNDFHVVFRNIKEIISDNGMAILEFWTNRANPLPIDGTNEIPPEIKSVNSEMLGESFLCEIKELPKLARTRYRFHCVDQPFSYAVIKSETEEEIHRHYFVEPDAMRKDLIEHGFRLVGEYGMGKELGKLALTDFDESSKIWIVTLST